MYSFVAKQPILNTKKKTVAYELLFRNGLTNAYPKGISSIEATASIITEQFLSHPIEKLVGDCLCFINFPYSLIVENLVDFLPIDQVVIEILEDCEPNDTLLASVKELKKKGFKIALDDFTMDDSWGKFLPYIDIIKFDFRAYPLEYIVNFIKNNSQYKIKYLAEKIETNDEFIFATNLGFSLFQGYFFSKPEIVQNKALSQNQIAVFQLLKEVNTVGEINFDKIEILLKRDLSLAYKLLRYVNNVRYGFSNPITSFRNAAVYLGQKELRRFVALISATSLGNDTPSELYQLSLTRAHFCELLSKLRKGHTDPQEAFLCGLFSLLEPIMERPLVETLKEMPIADDIKQALLANKGELAFYLNFVKDYESLNFAIVKKRAAMMNMKESDAIKIYQDSVEWATAILKNNE
ncbi:MAG: EAL and HDOD domain-containing protein [Succinivibrionaceae bacterium]